MEGKEVGLVHPWLLFGKEEERPYILYTIGLVASKFLQW